MFRLASVPLETLLESPVGERSMSSTNTDPMSEGKIPVHESELSGLVMVTTSGMSSGIPERPVRDRLAHYHLTHRHGAHTLGLEIFQGLLL